ncbi:response regulator [Thermanaerosceptrum fracticalcis]|uniref:Stage 0 sporulation protein A homolog n=1 Tax=Thermanaerosceptrum fracticalcis TaxID=1712410 RepID=A0A7G6E2V8_THEFR|nr:LytTR family DNA-binding domain-containing protein [Thermanaerosceptrum fracticalcis]QNB46412.1 response regulator [Thermanaerosceptrum fracticalcis]
MPLRILIIDDEEYICDDLNHILQKFKDVLVMGQYHDGDSGLEAIKLFKPDIVFLDIKMPGLNGIEIGRHIQGSCFYKPYIIYVTAYDQFALDAFKVDAIDYLLKPLTQEDIEKVLEKARVFHASREALCQVPQKTAAAKPVYPGLCRISGQLEGKTHLLDPTRILMAYARDRQVFIYADGKEYLSSQSLQELEKILEHQMFFRCHRNYLVNLLRIKEVIPWFNGSYLLVMDEKKFEISVSRKRVKLLKQIFNLPQG